MTVPPAGDLWRVMPSKQPAIRCGRAGGRCHPNQVKKWVAGGNAYFGVDDTAVLGREKRKKKKKGEEKLVSSTEY